MLERLTDRLRKVTALASEEAKILKHKYIGTEHILLAMVREGSGVGATALKNLDIDLAKVQKEVEKLIKCGPDEISKGKLPQTPRAKKAVEDAIEEARAMRHRDVGTEHLLLGLLSEKEGVAAQVLMNLGLSIEAARREILRVRGSVGQVGKDGPVR